MCGLAVHGLTPPTTQRSSSSATRSEGQRLPQFFVRVFLDVQTGQPPGSRHEGLPSHDAPGDFLFDACCTNLLLPTATLPETFSPHLLRNGWCFLSRSHFILRGCRP